MKSRKRGKACSHKKRQKHDNLRVRQRRISAQGREGATPTRGEVGSHLGGKRLTQPLRGRISSRRPTTLGGQGTCIQPMGEEGSSTVGGEKRTQSPSSSGSGNRKSMYSCRKCGLHWVEGGEFGLHMKHTHRRRIYLCTWQGGGGEGGDCDRVFIRRDSLKFHQMEHEGRYSYTCATCGKGFNHKAHYEGHVNTHTNTRPHSCDKCTKSFSYLSDYIRHSKICGAQSDIKCDLCDKTFSSATYLTNHVKFFHRMGEPRSCPVCNREFYYASSYRTHVKSHNT